MEQWTDQTTLLLHRVGCAICLSIMLSNTTLNPHDAFPQARTQSLPARGKQASGQALMLSPVPDHSELALADFPAGDLCELCRPTYITSYRHTEKALEGA